MRTYRYASTVVIIAAVVMAAGCARKEPQEPATATTPAAPAAQPAPPEPGVPSGTQPALGASSWRLVKIMSMDDTTHTPNDPSLYTLEFLDDGSMRVKADCNMGTGSWTSASPGQLEFGVIAATQAECGPDSLHDTYMAQFQWVRSYVMENGHLFLATMADGSIIEFEPALP